MGIALGLREYHSPTSPANTHSLSSKRAAIIEWHRLHPNADALFKNEDARLGRTWAKVRWYNEAIYILKKRIGTIPDGSNSRLSIRLKRVSSLKATAERIIISQTLTRNMLAEKLFEWRETLPQLEKEISRETRRR